MQLKTDYSFLFSGANRTSNQGFDNMSSFLSDYKSIKNGSYGKLMRSYYNLDKTEKPSKDDTKNDVQKPNTNSTSISTDTSKTLVAIEKDAESLKTSADKLWVGGKTSLFTEKELTTKAEDGTETTTRGYDHDAIGTAVQNFAKSYNDLMASAKKSTNSSIAQAASSLQYGVQTNSKLLAKVGVTIDQKGALSVDADKLKNADISTLKTLFQGENSLAYRASAQASMIDYHAQRESERANTYTSSALFGNNYNSGNIFADYF